MKSLPIIIANDGMSFCEIDMIIDVDNIEFHPGGYVCFFDPKGFCIFRIRGLPHKGYSRVVVDSDSSCRKTNRYIQIDDISSEGDGEYSLGPLTVNVWPATDIELTFI